MGGGITGGLQNIDGYYYYMKGLCPPELITTARETEWSSEDLFLATYPKSGTHFGMLTSLLILLKGEIPPKSDLHTLTSCPEFNTKANNARSLDDPSVTQPRRLLISHMPQHHVKYSETAKYVYIMREPVASLASQRRMDNVMFGPIMNPTLKNFINFHLYTRETGWLGNHSSKWLYFL
jgi:hypothetical protein